MTDAKTSGHNGWITTNPDNHELKLWPLVPGMYWVIFRGDSESIDWHTLYDYDDYRGIFEIRGHDEDSGVPFGDEYVGGGCDWYDVIAYYQHEIAVPEKYNA